MLGKQIYLYQEDETIHFDRHIPFACTTNFENSFSSSGMLWTDFIQYLQNNKVFLVLQKKKGLGLQILLDKFVLNCAINEDCFTIKHISSKTVRVQNDFIRNSIKVKSEYGALVWKNHQIYTQASVVDRELARSRFPKGQILAYLSEEDENDLEDMAESDIDNETDDDSDNGFELMDELLDIAAFYNAAEDEIQQSEAQSGSQLGYFRIAANSDHNRVEKIAYTFHVSDFDKNKYKKGSRVNVNSLQEEDFTGSIVEVQDESETAEMTILFDEKFDIHDLPPAGYIWLDYNPMQRQVRETVIESIRNATSRAEYFEHMLHTKSMLSYDNEDTSELIHSLNERKYPPNPSQIDAIVKGIQAKEALLVLGPPGTGKTTVILEWVKYFVKQGNRVLISSQNNKAVDNVLERLSKEKDIETIRIGSEEKVQSNIQPFMFERKSIELQKNITRSTQKHLQYLHSDEERVKNYQELALQGEVNWQQFQAVDHWLHEAYSSIETVTIKPIRNIYHDYKETLDRVDLHKQTLDQLLVVERSFQESGKLMKLLRYPAHKIRINKLNQIYEDYHKLIVKEEQLADDYNELSARLMKQLAENNLLQEKQRWQELQQRCNESAQQLLAVPKFESLLPTIELPEVGGSAIHLLNQSAIQHVFHQCSDIDKRIQWIRGAVNNWNGYLAMKQNYALAQVLLDSVNVVGATCIGINSQPRFKDIEFDVTIIDEAGQIQIHNAIVPMSRSPKVIMLGDHLQIPPTKDSQVEARCIETGTDTELLGTSFFEYLYKRFPDTNKILLDTQYRMPGEIADVLSEWFYEGKYKSFDGKREMKSALPSLFTSPLAVVSTSDHSRRREVKVEKEGYYNPFECEWVIQILKEALQTINPDTMNRKNTNFVVGGRCFLPEEIGVITPYKYQVNYVRNRVLEQIPELFPNQVNDLIASLDSFQGQERPIIIYSCTRSNDKSPESTRIGFLKELRRLNVALSRCQQQLVFVGDVDFLLACKYEEKDEWGEPLVDEQGRPLPGTSEKEFADFMRMLLESVQEGNGQILHSQELQRILDNIPEVHNG